MSVNSINVTTEIEKSNISNREFNVLTRRLSSTLLIYIRAVIKKQLRVTGSDYTIGYGPDWRDDCELKDSVMEEFGIRIYAVDKERSDREISIIFVLTGKLGEIFKSFGAAPFLKVFLQNNGDDFFTLTCEEDVEVIESCYPFFTNIKNESVYADFVEAIEKHLLFISLKYC